MSLRRLTLVACMSPFLLAGCGEGYEAVLTGDYFPYGNQRTAGSGVAYVLAKMLPEKELKLEPVEKVKRIVEEIEPAPKAVPAPKVETPMEDKFQKAQEK